ncbi:hypothetical protein SAMN05216480_101784 [Pustulibacterium marinum]|uniref:Uncharacterized protein n=1 Tax=Pustulibacterium marinum TaxID=1224947 RepID=A0A1I7FA39_9FLAO|nr:hypothetical protein [Pustulibacterium marinum]SFU33052.1 hypothetical protein SAMN05216480_101784 [Pustulibacterium marinum]
MERTSLLKTAHRIVVIYCLVFPLIKLIAIFKGSWVYANLIIMIAMLIVGGIGALLLKKNRYTWVYTIFGIIFISALRCYELDLMAYLHKVLG